MEESQLNGIIERTVGLVAGQATDFDPWGLSAGCPGCWYLRESDNDDNKLTAKHVGGDFEARRKATRLGPHDWLRLMKESFVH